MNHLSENKNNLAFFLEGPAIHALEMKKNVNARLV